MSREKDLFDDSTMSFGEHLEELRKRLILALLGLTVGVIISLFFSDRVMKTMEIPVKNALARYYKILNGEEDPGVEFLNNLNPWKKPKGEKAKPKVVPEDTKEAVIKTIDVQIDGRELLNALHEIEPSIPKAPPNAKPFSLTLTIAEKALSQIIPLPPTALSLVALTAEEAFMVYLKVALVAGLMLSSPWVFYQMWLFVAAGLYPHERKYVYIYLPMSLFLFFGGAIFCFFAVIPFVLNFLFDFNIWLDITIQPRLTEYVSFVVILPVMFGISFQLPLVMLFLERINVFNVKVFREKRRLAILAIAFLSMILTPSDPVSMMLMMIPLCLLYELGIMLCTWQPQSKENPFDDGKTTLITKGK
ncbi:MAG: Sec-independent protein translocase, TatC subunit [Planctomycetaceae bacterium]|nr:Sec-independent protein translocase, TatC subunit [Planctomycetaceae bacterium]